MKFPSEDGYISLPILTAADASRVATYWSAIEHYLTTGDDRRLRPFRNASLRVGRERHEYVTDLDVIERLAHAGELSFPDIYDTTA
jgi:hypothetical protein